MFIFMFIFIFIFIMNFTQLLLSGGSIQTLPTVSIAVPFGGYIPYRILHITLVQPQRAATMGLHI